MIDSGRARREGVRRRAIATAASALDEFEPGWADKITRPIHLHSFTECVVGQIYGHFNAEEARAACAWVVKSGSVMAFASIFYEPYWEAEVEARRNTTFPAEWKKETELTVA